MPGLVAVRHTAASDDLIALGAPSSKLIFVARGAVNVVVPRNEAASSNGVLADAAAEAFLVPLVALVLHLLRTCVGLTKVHTINRGY